MIYAFSRYYDYDCYLSVCGFRSLKKNQQAQYDSIPSSDMMNITYTTHISYVFFLAIKYSQRTHVHEKKVIRRGKRKYHIDTV